MSDLTNKFPVNDEQIDRVAKELEASGTHPSVDAVFAVIGKNRVKIAQRLKIRKEERLNLDALTTAGLSPVIVEAVRTLQAALESESKAQVEAIEQETSITIHSLESEKAHLQEALDALKKNNEDHEDQIGELLGANDSLTRQLSESEREALKLKEKLEAQEDLVLELRTNNAKLNEQFEKSLEKQADLNELLISTQQAHEKELQEQIKQHGAHIARLNNKHTNELEELTQAFDQQLKQQALESEERSRSLEASLSKEKEALSISRNELATSVAENRERSGQLSDVQSQLSDQRLKYEELKRSVSSLEHELHESQTELAVSKAKLEDKEKQMSEQHENMQLLINSMSPKKNEQ